MKFTSQNGICQIETGSHTVGFTYTGSTGGLDSVVWTFGDGSTSTGTPALHTYTALGTYHVCVIVYTTCGVDSLCSDVTATVPSEVTAVPATATIQVYPNPSKDELFVRGLSERINYRLLSVTGICLQQGLLEHAMEIISMKDYASGIYILELNGEKGERKNVRVVKE